jgi:hypothetical protein
MSNYQQTNHYESRASTTVSVRCETLNISKVNEDVQSALPRRDRTI